MLLTGEIYGIIKMHVFFIKEGRCLCASRTTIYKLISTHQLVLPKHFILPESTKAMEQRIQHPKTLQSHVD